MNLPDSFYIALCMTILLVGAVYWVWTQIQYVQRKVNVLENIVYELKTLCSRPPDSGPIAPTNYPPAPPSVLGEDEDLLHETLSSEVAPYATVEEVDANVEAAAEAEPTEPAVTTAPFVNSWVQDASAAIQAAQAVAAASQAAAMQPQAQVDQEVHDIPAEVTEVADLPDVAPDFSEPVFDMGHYVVQSEEKKNVSDDLQPGGVGSGITVPSIQSSLEGMTTKELRRLAQQKGISGANELKKKDLIEAIRAIPIESFLE